MTQFTSTPAPSEVEAFIGQVVVELSVAFTRQAVTDLSIAFFDVLANVGRKLGTILALTARGTPC